MEKRFIEPPVLLIILNGLALGKSAFVTIKSKF
jgi:hypothetical protein